MNKYDEKGFLANRPLPPEDWRAAAPDMPDGLIVTRGAAPPGVLMIHNYLDANLCDSVVKEADQAAGRTAQVRRRDQTQVDSPKRVCDLVRHGDLKTDLIDIVRGAFANVIGPHFNQAIDTFEAPEILRYKPGGFYVTHADSEIWNPAEKTWRRGIERDLSLLIYLNEGFVGGDLLFPNFDMRVKPTRGLLVAFPSDHRYLHCALPLKSGVRFAVVSWAKMKGGERAAPSGAHSHAGQT